MRSAPELTPRIYGPARGLRNRVCIINPDTDNAAPANTATMALGRLDNAKAVEGSDVVVLAVKPWLIQQVIEEIEPELKHKLLISVAATVWHERIDVSSTSDGESS